MIVAGEVSGLLSIVMAASEQLATAHDPARPIVGSWAEFHESEEGRASVVVVFGVILVEAYIQNYASRRLGKTFTEKHIDRLDTLSKCLIVPKLVTTKDVRADHVGIALLRDLIKERNAIVHPKGGVSTHEELKAYAHRAGSKRASKILAGLNTPYCLLKLGELWEPLDSRERFPRALISAFEHAELYRRSRGKA